MLALAGDPWDRVFAEHAPVRLPAPSVQLLFGHQGSVGDQAGQIPGVGVARGVEFQGEVLFSTDLFDDRFQVGHLDAEHVLGCPVTLERPASLFAAQFLQLGHHLLERCHGNVLCRGRWCNSVWSSTGTGLWSARLRIRQSVMCSLRTGSVGLWLQRTV